LKSYERFVVWLDYFDSELKRSQGRRIPVSSAVRSPTLTELVEACRRLNLDPQPQPAKHPRSVPRPSGYVAVKKLGPKQSLVAKIARELALVRGQASKTPRKV
jgi:signal recognition particle subunit SRP19